MKQLVCGCRGVIWLVRQTPAHLGIAGQRPTNRIPLHTHEHSFDFARKLVLRRAHRRAFSQTTPMLAPRARIRLH
eukprot:10666873-Lingulodinium_polyedra.AAC.1